MSLVVEGRHPVLGFPIHLSILSEFQKFCVLHPDQVYQSF